MTRGGGAAAFFSAGVLGALVGLLVVWLTSPSDVVAMMLGSGGTLAGLAAGIPLAIYVEKKQWERRRR